MYAPWEASTSLFSPSSFAWSLRKSCTPTSIFINHKGYLTFSFHCSAEYGLHTCCVPRPYLNLSITNHSPIVTKRMPTLNTRSFRITWIKTGFNFSTAKEECSLIGGSFESQSRRKFSWRSQVNGTVAFLKRNRAPGSGFQCYITFATASRWFYCACSFVCRVSLTSAHQVCLIERKLFWTV